MYCTKATDYLTSKGARFNVVTPETPRLTILRIIVEEQVASKRIEKGLLKYKDTYPMIFHLGLYIGGYNELVKKLKGPAMATSPIHMRVGESVSESLFGGRAFDQLVSLVYLNYRHKNNCTPIPASLLGSKGRLPKAGSFTFAEMKIKMVQSKRGEKPHFDVPKNYWKAIQECLEKETDFITIPLGFSCPDPDDPTVMNHHANFLIYDKKRKELERFEPNGQMETLDPECFGWTGLDEELKRIFNKYVQKGMVKTALPPLSFCPEEFQVIQAQEGEDLPSDIGGWCGVWTVWYAETRLLNPNKTREQVVALAMNELRNSPKSMTKFIRDYSALFANAVREFESSDDPEAVFRKLLGVSTFT